MTTSGYKFIESLWPGEDPMREGGCLSRAITWEDPEINARRGVVDNRRGIRYAMCLHHEP